MERSPTVRDQACLGGGALPDAPATSLARPFLGIVILCCLTLSALTAVIAIVDTGEHAETVAMGRHLRSTLDLNSRFKALVDRQTPLLNAAMAGRHEVVDAELRPLHFEAGRLVNRYFALADGVEARLTVERIRTLESTLSFWIQNASAMVRAGRTEAAHQAHDQALAAKFELDDQFLTLSSMGAERLGRLIDAHEPGWRMTLAAVVGSFVALVSCGGLLILLRRRVIVPLESMVGVTARVGAGDYSARIDLSTSDELGTVGRRLNAMIEQLAESHADLEDKIAKRTAELRETNERLFQSEKMAALGRLVGGVAHELNNPLTAIIGFASLVRDALTTGDPRRERLGHVIEQSDRCRRIVADLLQFSRRREQQLEPIELGSIVLSTLQVFEPAARLAGAQIATVLPEEPVFVRGDAQRIQQVLVVLLTNAVDAIEEQGKRGRIELRLEADADAARLEVLDDGCGVRDPRRIFEPFYTTKSVGKGTGLGLSICFGIVRDHEGAIRVENRPEGGACFTVTLPTTTERPVAGDGEASARCEILEELHRWRILVVDDEPSLLSLQSEYLDRMGFNCVTANSGDEAKRILETEKFDAVVADVRMPGSMSGIDLYVWLQEFHPQTAKRVLLVTGDVFAVAEGRLGSVSCLAKPFDYDAYSATVQALWGPR